MKMEDAHHLALRMVQLLRMLALVNDLLDVSKLESMVGTLHFEPADLRPLLHEVQRELMPLLDARQLTLALQLPSSSLTARIDPARLIMGAGSGELLYLAASAYAGPGDEVLFSQYSFSLYDIVARRSGAEPVEARPRITAPMSMRCWRR